MGDYATNAELKARFEDDAAVAHLTDTAASDPDEAVLTEVIEGAEGELNSYIGARYSTPVDVTADVQLENLLRTKTLDIAQCVLISRGDAVSEAKQRLHDAAIQWARDVSRGIVVLPASAPPPTTAAKESSVDWGDNDAAADNGSNRVFTRTSQRAL